MAAGTSASASGDHPSPHRGRVGLAALFFGLIGGPLAWSLQLVVNFALASHSCFPRDLPQNHLPAGWEGVWNGLLAVNIGAILLALIATAVSYRNWHVTHGEDEGSTHQLVEAGEGRTRFLGFCGTLLGLGFFVAILFNSLALFMVPQCAG
jgi:hypothetical protein